MKPEDKLEKRNDTREISPLTRRGFLKVVGVFTIGAGATGLMGCEDPEEDPSQYPSRGYILVDSRKCTNCMTCMVSCAMVNEGCASLSLSRIQMSGDHFGLYPNDTRITQCRQCEDPECVKACPMGALFVDTSNGNVRRVDYDNCIGCGRCVMACPHEPERVMIEPHERYGSNIKSRKCDLCLSAPYHFSPDGGGVNGKRTCESVCPVGAIIFARSMPVQDGDGGYEVNLRNIKWKLLGNDIKL